MTDTDPKRTDLPQPGDFVWGAREIAKFIGRSEKAAFWMLERGQVPGAKKIAGRWALSIKVFAAAFEDK